MPTKAKKKTTSQVPAKATTQAKGKSTAKKVNAPLPPQPQNSSTKPPTRSQMPPPIDDTVVNDDGNGKHDATSSTPLVTNPGRVETRTGNTSQHPGQLQNAYTRKRRTKEEMIEVRRIAAEKKAQKAEEAERQTTKHKKAIRLVADYEEQLMKMNIDNTPIARAGHRALTAEAEATPIPPNRRLRRSYAALDVTQVDEAQSGGEDDEAQSTGENGEAQSGGEDGEAQSRGEDDEEPPFVEESEVTNQHDDDYAEEEDEEDEDMFSEATGVKIIATAREKRKKNMIKEIEAPDSETDEDARPKKKAKDSTAAKRLIPRDEVQERTPGKTTVVDGKKKAKQGVLLRGAVNTLRSEGPERNKGPVGADFPKRQSTLYFWNLGSTNTTTKNDGVIANWANTVSKLSSSSQSTGGSSRASTLNFSTRRSSTQATSTTSKSGAKKVVNLPALSEKSDDDTDQESQGAFSDNDETIGKERDAAVNSPPKNGARATNSGIVKVEDVQLTKTLRAQPRSKTGRKLALSNRDLPDGVHEKDRWHRHFIPTFLCWVGRQPDPWNLPDNQVVAALQQIWDVVYKKIPYTVEPKDAVVAVALQRVSDSWRATAGSTAIIVINTVFENSDGDFLTDDDRQAFAQQQLDSLEFLYGDVESMPYRHLLQGPLILHTLAAHYCAIHGAVKVPSLGDLDLPANQPYGALALSAAAVDRGFTLIANGNITIQALARSKLAQRKLVFEKSSSDTKGITNFSDKWWGTTTREYVHSAKSLLEESRDRIFSDAKRFSKDMISRRSIISSDTQAEEPSEPLGRRAMLVDIA